MSPIRRPHLVIITLLITGLCLSGCGQTHIKPYEPRSRDYTSPVEISEREQVRKPGSLWSEGSEANILFADLRAMRPGDIMTVRVEEFANAQRGAQTNLRRQSELNAEIVAFLGLMEQVKKVAPGLEETLVDTKTGSSFDASGSSGRSERLEATVPCIIKKMLGNSHVFVEGHRVVLVNNEEHHFYISGVARLQDIDQSNAISSARLADAEIEFTGRGDISDQQRQGIFARFWSRIWPF
jgi:flagellar L-ring protein precursor FlgH